jgi:hypothetical protein
MGKAGKDLVYKEYTAQMVAERMLLGYKAVIRNQVLAKSI